MNFINTNKNNRLEKSVVQIYTKNSHQKWLVKMVIHQNWLSHQKNFHLGFIQTLICPKLPALTVCKKKQFFGGNYKNSHREYLFHTFFKNQGLLKQKTNSQVAKSINQNCFKYRLTNYTIDRSNGSTNTRIIN